MSHGTGAASAPITAVLFANWSQRVARPLGDNLALLPALGRPMLQRAMEQLVRLGCQRIVVVLGEDSASFRAFLENGRRWGCEVTYQYSRPGEALPQLLHWLDPQVTPHCWLADAQTLPEPAQLDGCGSMCLESRGCTLCWNDLQGQHWSGWGLFNSQWLREQPIPVERGALAQRILGAPRIEKHQGAEPLRVTNAACFLSSNMRLLNRGQDQNIQIGRDCSIDPSARIVAPVHLGDHVRIGPRCVVGPHAVVGDNCLIESEAQLQSCVVLPNTYIGEGIDLNSTVVNGHRLANIAIDTVIEVADRNILCTLSGRAPAERRDRWNARLLRVLLAPLHWVCRLRCAKAPADTTLGAAPDADNDRYPWARHFVETFYPSLPDVVRGRLRMVGPLPRDQWALQQLPPHWRHLYDTHSAGLLSEALTRDARDLDPDELFASDAMACARHDQSDFQWALLRRYLANVLNDVLSDGLQHASGMPAKPGTSSIHHRPI